jgi:CRP/FNR family transcriptional regulator, cyclic AMP receptor protein
MWLLPAGWAAYGSGMARPDHGAAAEVLRRTDVFGGLDDAALADLAARSRTRTYRRGQYIWYQGDPGDTLLVVCGGLVKVVFGSDAGEEAVLVTLGECSVLGELAVLDGSARSASVVAVEPTTALLLGRATVLDVMARHRSVLDAMLRALGALVRRLTEQNGDLVFLDLGGRVAKLLLRLAEGRQTADGGVVLDTGLTQSELAAMVGATRQAVNKVLHGFAARGLIGVDGQVIVLRDIAELRRRAGVLDGDDRRAALLE